MKRMLNKCRMGPRGRSGVVVYIACASLGLVLIYYAWSSYFTPTSKLKLTESREIKHPNGLVLEEPPSELNREIQEQKAQERLLKQKAEQDRLDEERLLEEKAAKANQGRIRPQKGPSSQDSNPRPLLFQEADPSDGDYFHKLQKLVHLDLKGAPPMISYFEKLFPLLKSLGATGLLVEYEDMFPYSGVISTLAAHNAYSEPDIQKLKKIAKDNHLEIVPLVQTFGHMEFVLKYQQYRHLRENEYTPQVITPDVEESYKLLENMVDQVLKAHPESTLIHLGCDEVYGLGKGQSNKILVGQKIDASELFLRHVVRVAKYVKTKYAKVQPLIWDDHLRKIQEDIIQRSGLDKLVEPVVWFYRHDILDSVTLDTWKKYGRLFPGVWVASAFKGATGSAQYITNASFHIDNNLQWVNVMRTLGAQKSIINFRGVALTGWQRYDHFAVLCELFPVGLPSLALCLQTIQMGGFGEDVLHVTSKQLRCSNNLDLEFPVMKKDGAQVTQDCSFPGSSVYYAVHQLWGIIQLFEQDSGLQQRINGWMTEYHLRRGFSSPGQMHVLINKMSKLLENLNSLVKPMQQSLSDVFDSSTVQEWIETNLNNRISQFTSILNKAKNLNSHIVWPPRPLEEPSTTPAGVIPPVQNRVDNWRDQQIPLKNDLQSIDSNVPVQKLLNQNLNLPERPANSGNALNNPNNFQNDFKPGTNLINQGVGHVRIVPEQNLQSGVNRMGFQKGFGLPNRDNPAVQQMGVGNVGVFQQNNLGPMDPDRRQALLSRNISGNQILPNSDLSQKTGGGSERQVRDQQQGVGGALNPQRGPQPLENFQQLVTPDTHRFQPQAWNPVPRYIPNQNNLPRSDKTANEGIKPGNRYVVPPQKGQEQDHNNERIEELASKMKKEGNVL